MCATRRSWPRRARAAPRWARPRPRRASRTRRCYTARRACRPSHRAPARERGTLSTVRRWMDSRRRVSGCRVPVAGCWVHVEHLLVAGRDAELVVVVDPRRLEALVPELLAVALLAARGEDAPAARLERERGVEAAARRAASDQDRAALVGHGRSHRKLANLQRGLFVEPSKKQKRYVRLTTWPLPGGGTRPHYWRTRLAAQEPGTAPQPDQSARPPP